MEKETYLIGSCWNKEDISLNGSASASWWVDEDEEDEVGDVTSSNESDSDNSDDELPFETSESEEKKEPSIISS